MSSPSHVAKAVQDYEALKRMIEDLSISLTEALQEKESALVTALIETASENAQDLAHKAQVLLDWIATDDVVAQLTTSVCSDAIRMAVPSGSAASDMGT
jgi:hypothetical protein